MVYMTSTPSPKSSYEGGNKGNEYCMYIHFCTFFAAMHERECLMEMVLYPLDECMMHTFQLSEPNTLGI